MPNEYTHGITFGQTFEEFALRCAELNAGVELFEDEGGNLVVEYLKPTGKHARRVVEERARLAQLEAMTAHERLAGYTAWHAAAEEKRLTALSGMNELRELYTDMRARVVDWKPPTPGHEGMKVLMLEQIDKSIANDCNSSLYDTPTPRITPIEWLEREKLATLNNIEYHSREDSKELQNIGAHNTWVRQLHESLQPKKGS